MINTTHYVSYYHANGSAKFPKGWYAFQATVSEDGKIVVHKNLYNYSKSSRGEAVEKMFKTRVGTTRLHESHHNGLECLDFRFNPNDILAA